MSQQVPLIVSTVMPLWLQLLNYSGPHGAADPVYVCVPIQ